MKKLKSMFYSNSFELMISVLSIIPIIILLIVLSFKKSTLTLILLFISYGVYFLCYIWAYISREKFNYFSISYSKLKPKYVWINQRVKRSNKDKQCPKVEFMKELYKLKEKLPDGKIYMCCTQEHIAKHIKKNFKIIKEFKAYDKDLKKLKKKIQNKQCKECSKECTLKKTEVISFYALRFTK